MLLFTVLARFVTSRFAFAPVVMPEEVDPNARNHATDAKPDLTIELGLDRGRGRRGASALGDRSVVFDVDDLMVHYGDNRAVHDVTMKIYRQQVTALIGPSGCGKTTVLRCFNRMNDLIRSARVSGQIRFHGRGPVRRRPSTSPRCDGASAWSSRSRTRSRSRSSTTSPTDRRSPASRSASSSGVVEKALRSAALWDEVKDRLHKSALGLSGGQQQRLCIARAIAVEPEVILMDEPCSALDPVSTARIEDLMAEIKSQYTIVIVTHNMQQAARASDMTAFFTAEADEVGGNRSGVLVEYDGHAADLLEPIGRAGPRAT